MSFRVINGRTYAIGHFNDNTTKSQYEDSKKVGQAAAFIEVLNKQVNESDSFKISNHAAERIKTLNLTQSDMKKIGEGINNAKDKGCKNSLILYKNIAFLTSIENRTVITAIERDRAKENLYTNIDSVLFL